jgi:hypothetical protein
MQILSCLEYFLCDPLTSDDAGWTLFDICEQARSRIITLRIQPAVARAAPPARRLTERGRLTPSGLCSWRSPSAACCC